MSLKQETFPKELRHFLTSPASHKGSTRPMNHHDGVRWKRALLWQPVGRAARGVKYENKRKETIEARGGSLTLPIKVSGLIFPTVGYGTSEEIKKHCSAPSRLRRWRGDRCMMTNPWALFSLTEMVHRSIINNSRTPSLSSQGRSLSATNTCPASTATCWKEQLTYRYVIRMEIHLIAHHIQHFFLHIHIIEKHCDQRSISLRAPRRYDLIFTPSILTGGGASHVEGPLVEGKPPYFFFVVFPECPSFFSKTFRTLSHMTSLSRQILVTGYHTDMGATTIGK